MANTTKFPQLEALLKKRVPVSVPRDVNDTPIFMETYRAVFPTPAPTLTRHARVKGSAAPPATRVDDDSSAPQ